jgi:hypothetical protein
MRAGVDFSHASSGDEVMDVNSPERFTGPVWHE